MNSHHKLVLRNVKTLIIALVVYTTTILMPLERQFAFFCGLVQVVMLVVQLVDLRLRQFVEAHVGPEVHLDVFRHRLGPPHDELVEQVEEIQRGTCLVWSACL